MILSKGREVSREMEWIEYWDKINSNLSKRITVILCGKDNEIICYGINLFINGIEKIINPMKTELIL